MDEEATIGLIASSNLIDHSHHDQLTSSMASQKDSAHTSLCKPKSSSRILTCKWYVIVMYYIYIYSKCPLQERILHVPRVNNYMASSILNTWR